MDMRSNSVLFVFCAVIALVSCSSTSPETAKTSKEDEIVNYLMPKIFGDADRVEDLRPADLGHIRLYLFGGKTLTHKLYLSEYSSKKPRGVDALSIFFSDRIFGVTSRESLKSEHVYNSINMANVLAVSSIFRRIGQTRKFDRTTDVAIDKQDVLRIVGKNDQFTHPGSKLRLSESNRAIVFLFKDQKPLTNMLAKLKDRTPISGKTTDFHQMSKDCAVYTVWDTQNLNKISILFHHFMGDELNMANQEGYACFSYFIARQWDLRAVDDEASVTLHYPPGEKLNPKIASGCIIAKTLPVTAGVWFRVSSHEKRKWSYGCNAHRKGQMPLYVYNWALRYRDSGDRSFTRKEFSDLIRETYRSLPKEVLEQVPYGEEQVMNERWEEPRDVSDLKPVKRK